MATEFQTHTVHDHSTYRQLALHRVDVIDGAELFVVCRYKGEKKIIHWKLFSKEKRYKVFLGTKRRDRCGISGDDLMTRRGQKNQSM